MSTEYDLWNDPEICLDPCCILDGKGDPLPGVEGGAIPVDPDEEGHLSGWWE